MDFWSVSPDTGELGSQGAARVFPGREPLSDDDPNKFQFPAHTTREAPPEAQPGYAIVRVNDGWEFVEDHRGETVYLKEDGTEHVIEKLGPIPAQATTKPRPSEWHAWSDGADDWVEDTEAKDAEAAREAHREDAKTDPDADFFLELLSSKTAAQRADWLGSNVKNPKVRRLLAGMMSVMISRFDL